MKLKPTVVKARRTLIALSQEIQLEGYMMPDGQYTLNPTSLANAIKKDKKVLWEFLGGKSPQPKPAKALKCGKSREYQLNGEAIGSNPSPVRGIGTRSIQRR
jgi:hypothetical protein